MKYFTRRELNKAIAGVEGKDVNEGSRREALTRLGLISATGALFYACGKSDDDDDDAVAPDTTCKTTTDKALAEAKAKWEKEAKDAAGKATAAKAAADVGVLNAAVGLEHGAVAVYTAAAGLPIWGTSETPRDPTYLTIAGAFLSHHAQHVTDLAKVIKELGGTPVATKTATEYLAADGITNPNALTLAAVLQYALKKELGAAQAFPRSSAR